MRPTERPLKDTWRLVWCPLQPLSDQSRSQDETRWAAGQQTHKGLIVVTVRTCDMLERWRCNQWCWCGVSEDRRLMLVMWRVQAGQTSSAWWILSHRRRGEEEGGLHHQGAEFVKLLFVWLVAESQTELHWFGLVDPTLEGCCCTAPWELWGSWQKVSGSTLSTSRRVSQTLSSLSSEILSCWF